MNQLNTEIEMLIDALNLKPIMLNHKSDSEKIILRNFLQCMLHPEVELLDLMKTMYYRERYLISNEETLTLTSGLFLQGASQQLFLPLSTVFEFHCHGFCSLGCFEYLNDQVVFTLRKYHLHIPLAFLKKYSCLRRRD